MSGAPRKTKWVSFILVSIFFLTGAASLIYEVIWVRLLILVFGATVFAVSTILVSFMGGLALGAVIFGRLSDRVVNPLRLYALLELGVAAMAALMPVIFKWTEILYASIYRAANPSFFFLSLMRLVISVVVLLIPTSLMGGTLPALVKFLARTPNSVGYNVALLYSVNTLGAVCGAFSAGFILIGTVGILGSTSVAVSLNLTAGAVSLLLSRGAGRALEPEPVLAQRKAEYPQAVSVFILWAIALSGFAALSYEIMWTRALSVVLANTTYSFTAMLTAFLFGIGLGSIIFAKLVDRWRHPVLVFGIVEWAIGISAVFVLRGFGNLPAILARTFGRAEESFWRAVAGGYLLSFYIMLLTTILLGITIPLAVKIYSRSLRSLGKSLGKVYSSNTAGAVLGSIAAGFVLIPFAGIRASSISISSLNILVGLSAFLFALTLQRKKRLALFFSGLLISSFAVPLLAMHYSHVLPLPLARGYRLLHYREGMGGTITVAQNKATGEKLCFVDNNLVCGTSYNALKTVRMLGHLPLVFCEKPKSVMVIGYGMGVTSYAVSLHPDVTEIHIAEIAPGIVDASAFFNELNRNVPEDERVTLHVEDGRNFLLLSQKKYDSITCDPTHPVLGSGELYTREYFRLCRSRLNPGGTVVQYLPLHLLSPLDFKSIIKTFTEVFPNSSLWFTFSHCILLGKLGEIQIDYSSLEEKLGQPAVRADLEESDLADPVRFLSSFMTDASAMERMSKRAFVNTDYLPRVGFSGTRSLRDTWATNLSALLSWRKHPIGLVKDMDAQAEAALNAYFLARGESIKGRILHHKGRYSEAMEHYQKALSHVGDDNETIMLASHAYARVKAGNRK